MADVKARNRCSIKACRSINVEKNEHVSFFKVPKDCLDIIQSCFPSTTLSDSSYICSRHFDEAGLVKGRFILGIFYKYSRWMLKKDAVPMYFLKDGKVSLIFSKFACYLTLNIKSWFR